VPNAVALSQARRQPWARSAAPYRCEEDQLLPCFLQFQEYTVPRSDASHMACRMITRRPAAQLRATCPPAVLPDEGKDVGGDVYGSVWDLPPSYYQYQGCRCLAGWHAAWSNDGTELRCLQDAPVQALPAWTWVLVALGGVLMLLAGSLLLLGSRWALFKARWLRDAELKRKRRLGVPRDGAAAAVVITDIEGYSSAWGAGEIRGAGEADSSDCWAGHARGCAFGLLGGR
jgi:hypothetical protein